MKAPLSWLKEYVDIDCSVEELKNKLFSCGFEVEDIIYTAGKVDKIVTCKILSIDKHPNADKLSLTKVDAGSYGELQIITSAKNISVGDIVPVALDGATLYNGDRIFNGELRGVLSNGMFCSGEELGINDDWYEGASVNGILILKEDYPLGVELKEILELDDVIFDINVTANRPDCQSILGLAREVSAVLNKPLKMPCIDYKIDNTISTIKTVTIKDQAFDLCSRYMGHYVKDVKIENSPLWLKRRLARMGIRSINNIVDITNYVLNEIGQPMHAFDLRYVKDNTIIIRRANDGESIITLDEKDFKLSNENLVICDAEKPVAIAGVMGGLNSGIKDDTTEILFESAKFARDNIRKTSRALGQRTDASSRYEKGVDVYSVELGMKRALHLIDQINCGTIASEEYDLINEPIVNKVINTTIEKVNGVLGINVPESEIVDILTRLDFKVELDNGNLKVIVPLYRDDVESYPDIAEEVIREYGYDKIVPSLLKTSAITAGGRTEEQTKIDELKNLLTGFGFNEMLSYSFVSEKEYDTFSIDDEFIKIINPLGEDLAVMRTSLLPSAVRTACRNITRKNFEGRLFELAKTYFPKQLPISELPTEKLYLSLAVFGENEDFFTLKGVVEGILDAFCFGAEVEYKVSGAKCMHPTRSADVIIDGEKVGYFGQINPLITEKLDVDKPVYAGEIYFDVLEKHFNSKILFKNISKFPSVKRDLAISVDRDVACGNIIKVIENNAGEFLQNVSLFDVYTGEQIEQGKKSMAFNLTFVSLERTLNVEEIDLAIKNILKALREELGAELR